MSPFNWLLGDAVEGVGEMAGVETGRRIEIMKKEGGREGKIRRGRVRGGDKKKEEITMITSTSFPCWRYFH